MERTSNNVLVAWILGSILALVGILGFIPALVTNDTLLGVLMISPMNNAVHLFAGAVLLAGAAIERGRNARLTNMVLGTVFLIVTVIGFAAPSATETIGVTVEVADNAFHLFLGVVLLGVAFGVRDPATVPAKI